MNATRSTQPAVELVLDGPNDERHTHQLSDEDQVLVGTSEHCGLQLRDDTLSHYHCVISFENGSVWVQDWSSASETLVNGQPISGKTEISDGDRLCIGHHTLVPRFSAAPSQNAPPAPFTTADSLNDLGQQTLPDAAPLVPGESPATGTNETLPPAEPAEEDPPADSLDPAPEEMQAEIDPWSGAAGGCTDSFADFSFAPDSFGDEVFDRETVELLRAEVEELQAALAQRDAAAEPLEQSHNGEHQDGCHETDPEPLVARLDQLLEEAERSDERIAVLEEMLHSAEQANQAGQEERHQLQQWIGEIENRIGQREAEWKAEIEAYQSQLADAHGQRDLIQQQLNQAAQRGGAEAQGYSETLERLQQRNQELQESLAAANKERAALKERLEQGDTQSDRELREERAQIAQERAAVSRMRHELSSKLAAFEEMPEPKDQPEGEFTGRLQALREHLREIHAQEKQEREQRDSTLTGRLAKLWNRVES